MHTYVIALHQSLYVQGQFGFLPPAAADAAAAPLPPAAAAAAAAAPGLHHL